jgi:hypothetical protein
MDTRHFELQDLLSTALIAVTGGDREGAERALRKALTWVEADWLSTPGVIDALPREGGLGGNAPIPPDPNDDEDDDD